MWGHVTNQIRNIFSCRKPMDTKQGKVLTYSKRFPPLMPHDHLITWPIWSHLTIRRIYVSTITRLMASKLGRMQAYGKRLRMQALKKPPTSCMLCYNENSNVKNLFNALTNKTLIQIKKYYIYLVYNRDPVIILNFFRQSHQ